MFWCQLVATVLAGTVQLGVQTWMFSNIREFNPFSRDDLAKYSTSQRTCVILSRLLGFRVQALGLSTPQVLYGVSSGLVYNFQRVKHTSKC